MEQPLKKTTFPQEFYNYFYTNYTYTNHNQIPTTKKKRNVKFLYCFKMAAKNEFSLREKSHVTKNLKTTFPKEFCPGNFAMKFDSN